MRLIALAFIALLGPLVSDAQDPSTTRAINRTLDALHNAASKADGPRYFAQFTNDAIYIGTDASERWTLAQFREFAEPYFKRGTGWTYKPRHRNIVVPNIPCHCIAWFDELLDSESYGTSRGTGVLRLTDGVWKVAQYALTFPVPNDLAKGMTDEIKTFEAKKKRER